jgi:DNA-directed RNA polymerase beta subunit
MMSQEDMPYCESTGIVPDIIINPHAIPSRMTVGQLLEMLVGKAGSLHGSLYDATPFRAVDTDAIGLSLASKGFDRLGEEYMVSGVSGELFESTIFVGVPYYMVLKHFVSEKVRSRGYGVVSPFSGQPVSGSQGGGLRFGEMEVDTIIAHGAYSVLSGLHSISDRITVKVCKGCGNMSENDVTCVLCGVDNISVIIPYSLKMLKHLVDACGIRMSFHI